MDEDHDGEARLEGRQPQFRRIVRQCRPDEPGKDAAGSDVGNRLSAKSARCQFDGRESVELHACDGIAQNKPAQAHHQEAPHAESDGRARGAEHAHQGTQPEAQAAASALHQHRRRKDRQHDTQMLHGDRQIGPNPHIGRHDCQHRQCGRSEHQRIAALGQRLADRQKTDVAQ
jgi:hypothetical protein